MSDHVVSTRHIQGLIRNGLALAEAVNGKTNHDRIHVVHHGHATDWSEREPLDVLEKAAADLRHAAEELTAERLSLLGFPQV